MSDRISARSEILERIQWALAPPSVKRSHAFAAIQRAYVRSSSLPQELLLAKFVENIRDYDSEVISLESSNDIPAALEQIMAKTKETAVVVDPAFPREWLPAKARLETDPRLAEVAITTCQVAVASTGTIFLVHHGAQGNRALTLLPNHHICLVQRRQVVETLPQAIAQIAACCSEPITSISGPSATSDIEMTRIRGVHGPNLVTVLLF